MNIIKQNPFRMLGLTGNATEKEIQKQISIIKRYAEVGKTKSFDYDFDFLGNFTRNAEDIQEASNCIEQAHKKIIFALFWFVENNQFDEIAFSNLKAREIEKSIAIWNKTLKEEITNKNYSSYLNLSTLYIALSTVNGQIELKKLQTGISLKGNLIHSNKLNAFSKLVTGNGIVGDPTEISKKIVDEVIELLKPYRDKVNGISTNDLISLFSSFPISIQKYVSAKFTEIPISNIENKIDKTLRKRKENPWDAEEYGEELYESTKNDIALLKKLMSSSNVQFQMIVNKLANEILQCSIDFFNRHIDENSEFDPIDDAFRIAKRAESIGATGHAKDRISETLITYQDWINDKTNRDQQERINEDVAFVVNKLEKFQTLPITIYNSRDLIASCEPKLINIKNELGSCDESYLHLSSAVVGNALGMIIEVVNKEQSQLQYDQSILISLSNTISSAISVLQKMESMDMDSGLRNNFSTNVRTIKNIASQLKEAKNATSNRSSSSGCYIATMAYGDSNHRQVMILRKYRDEKLSSTWFGRCFINFYYATSPHLVKLLENQKFINKLIRNFLDKLVNRIQ